MSYGSSGSSTCDVTVNLPVITGIEILTCAWFESLGYKKPYFDIYGDFFKFMTASDIATLKGNGYGDYGTGKTYTGNTAAAKNLVQASDSYSYDNGSRNDISSDMPEVHAITNPLIYGLDIPLMPPLLTSYSIRMTENLTEDDAVTAVNFGASSVTTDTFIQTIGHAFYATSETINIICEIGTTTDNSMFFNTSLYENGFRFDLVDSRVVRDVDEINDSSKAYGVRYIEDAIFFRARIQRAGLGGNVYLDRTDKYARIPFMPSATVSASISQQEKYLYHEAEQDQFFVLDLKKYALNGNRYIDSFFYIPKQGLTWQELKTWYNTTPTKVPMFVTGRKCSSTGKMYRAGKILSLNYESDDEIRIKVKAPAGSYKLQSAGYKSNTTGETQTGQVLRSGDGDILRENKAVTLS